MNIAILIACEESQAVTKAFREQGEIAFSCDIVSCSGGYPEWHFQMDVSLLLSIKWEMIIAFPPCTHLAVSGAPFFKRKQESGEQQQAIEFFMNIANAPCEKIAIENPVSIISSVWRKPDQYINPWEFGHPEQKKTGLWLKGLPKLKGTNNVYETMMALPKAKRERNRNLPPGIDRPRLRSQTLQGIAKAMAQQWGTRI